MKKKLHSSPTFIYLELLDPEVYAVINGLKQVFKQGGMSNSIHLTVRGPYSRSLNADELDKFQIILGNEPLLINGVGLFENSEDIVYIKLSSENLKKIWWKPDYPINQYGFNPHITIFKSKDKTLARKIYYFLKNEQLALLCHKFRLSAHIPKQGKLYPDNDISSQHDFPNLSRLGRVRSDILKRAEDLIINYKKLENSNPLATSSRQT